ncbi:ciliogenesis-associated TTC17-interacting protein-like [Sinocyclocheilus anshuiensis]|uniref:ciliogenesis-associated TTC17-interacting protein-like n=1 Tax=Sinocyclocheilus anshuiensis TaxID=1608454 RepID=UPI0007B7F213|nr:PREDICTED: ciliogenesis-associated TTC17-interacting protein-like [Sinocyclocheilus anshuiensis]
MEENESTQNETGELKAVNAVEFIYSIGSGPVFVRRFTCDCVRFGPGAGRLLSYISRNLEILEENHHEYVKLEKQTVDRKVHIVKQDDQLVLNRIISEKEGVKTQTHTCPLSSLKGFVSEASNLMILRILARQKTVPENMTFLSFDADTVLSKSVYRALGARSR